MVFLQHQSHLPSETMFAGIRFCVCLFLNKSNLKTNENVISFLQKQRDFLCCSQCFKAK